MFGIGYGFLNVLLFSSRKSEMNLTDPSFLGMIKVGAAHSEQIHLLQNTNFYEAFHVAHLF